MVSVKEATGRAIKFAQEVLDGQQASELRLQEIDVSTKGPEKVWVITLSMPKPSVGGSAFSGFLSRDHKTFTVSQETGEVLSMKIRELANAE